MVDYYYCNSFHRRFFPVSVYLESMRRFNYWLRLLTVFLERFRGVIFVGILLGALFFILLPRVVPLLPWLEKTETVGMVRRFTLEEMPIDIQNEISLGLTTIDESFNIKPGLAESWISEEDGKVWIFKLGEHSWQDGKPVRAQDINYNFSDAEVEIIDEKTIKFILRDPFAPFLSVISRPAFKKGLLGAGSWKVEKLSLVNRRFVEVLKLKNVKDSKTKVYRFYPTEESARIAFKLGEIRTLTGIVDPGSLREWPNAQIEENRRRDLYAGVFLNTIDPHLQNKSLRQALAYAIDKEDFGHERAISPISPDSWAFNPQVKPYSYSPERAKELLKTLSEEERERLTINLVTTPTLLDIADKIKERWEAVGVKTNIQVSNTPPTDFQTLLAIQPIPPDPDQYSVWHSSQSITNVTNYGAGADKPRESPRIDKLLEDGRRILDQEERRKIYVDFQRFLVEDSPVIFLYHPSTYTTRR